MMPEDKIGKSLGLEPIETVEGEIVEQENHTPVNTEENENDYKYARENFYNVIEKGSKALEDMLDVAKASEHPRAYEVVSTLMKTLVDANKDLVNLSEKRKEETKEDKPSNVTNNNLFVGSTSDLQQVLKDLREKENDSE
jgi:hypothetical protein